MTEHYEDEIERLERDATPGPWAFFGVGFRQEDGPDGYSRLDEDNAALIVRLRNRTAEVNAVIRAARELAAYMADYYPDIAEPRQDELGTALAALDATGGER